MAHIQKWLIVRDCDHKYPIVLDGSLEDMKEELHRLHSDHSDTGFDVWALSEPTKYSFEPSRLVAKPPVEKP